MDVQLQFISVPSILPVIVTAVALFLATNGPHNWPALWQEFTNPPPDARHAIRKPSPYYFVPLSPAEIELRRAQLMSYVQIYGIPLGEQQSEDGNNGCKFTTIADTKMLREQ
ncbi:hypothetical protein GPALN_014801 [Globodera pallida]|nr:hypothetical protein GPALN_014801 [Globodera pallida]